MIQNEFRAVEQRPEDVAQCLFAFAGRGVVEQAPGLLGPRFARERDQVQAPRCAAPEAGCFR